MGRGRRAGDVVALDPQEAPAQNRQDGGRRVLKHSGFVSPLTLCLHGFLFHNSNTTVGGALASATRCSENSYAGKNFTVRPQEGRSPGTEHGVTGHSKGEGDPAGSGPPSRPQDGSHLLVSRRSPRGPQDPSRLPEAETEGSHPATSPTYMRGRITFVQK